jgi:hypothetical protein
MSVNPAPILTLLSTVLHYGAIIYLGLEVFWMHESMWGNGGHSRQHNHETIFLRETKATIVALGALILAFVLQISADSITIYEDITSSQL